MLIVSMKSKAITIITILTIRKLQNKDKKFIYKKNSIESKDFQFIDKIECKSFNKNSRELSYKKIKIVNLARDFLRHMGRLSCSKLMKKLKMSIIMIQLMFNRSRLNLYIIILFRIAIIIRLEKVLKQKLIIKDFFKHQKNMCKREHYYYPHLNQLEFHQKKQCFNFQCW